MSFAFTMLANLEDSKRTTYEQRGLKALKMLAELKPEGGASELARLPSDPVPARPVDGLRRRFDLRELEARPQEVDGGQARALRERHRSEKGVTETERFPVKFYLVAMLFIIFDIETVFLYPWAVAYDELALFGLVEMGVFVAILLVAVYVYVWKRGGLEWAE